MGFSGHKKSISLKVKMAVLLTALPVLALLSYLYLALGLFKQDKEAYVFDSSVSVSRTLSAQIRSQISAFSSQMRNILEHRDPDGHFSASAQTRLGYETDFRYLTILKDDGSGAKYNVFSEIHNANISDTQIQQIYPFLEAEARTASVAGRSLKILPGDENAILLTIRFGQTGDPQTFIASAYLESQTLASAFQQAQLYASQLLDAQGNVIFAGTHSKNESSNNGPWKYFSQISPHARPDGTLTVTDEKGEDLLVSYSHVYPNGLVVVSVVPKKTAFKAVELMAVKSLLFFVALVLVSIVVSVVSSSQLTASLRRLLEATQGISQGNFEVQLPVKSGDEVGNLTKGFNVMATEISRLMNENIEKGRMEKELETAKLVQETLFPKSTAQISGLGIQGFYEPASECGGDWWHYFECEGKVFVCIGDVTGHGVPAALLTSAARSAVVLIEKMPGLTPSLFLEKLNQAIFEAAKGRLQMTFFVAAFDFATGTLTYANASHEVPFLMRLSESPLKKKDLLPLLSEETGCRLGQKGDSKYFNTEMTLARGDRVFFYTDGLNDIQSPEGTSWEERNMIKSLLTATNKTQELSDMVNSIIGDFQSYRQNSSLVDDVTFITCKYEGSNSAVDGLVA